MHEFSSLKKFPELICAYSDKSDGNMSLKRGLRDEALRNRNAFFDTLRVQPEDVAGMSLKHGTDIALVDESSRGKEIAGVDCLITKSKNIFLFVLTADCLPIIFYDRKEKILALAHVSRINALEHFAEKIIRKFLEQGSESNNITVVIGPGVGKESYIFDREELAARKFGKEWDNFIIEITDGRFGVDLLGCNAHQLVSAGVLREHIEGSDIDTIADKNFFSHYRSQKTGEPEGRMATIAGLR